MEAQGKNPPALENKPVPPAYLDYYVKAFWILSSTRAAGSNIQFQDMVKYLEMFSWFDPDEFITLIMRMDSAYLDQKNVGK